FINAKGEVAIEPRFDKIEDFDANGLAKVEENGKVAYINTQGEYALYPVGVSGLFKIDRDERTDYLDKEQKVIFSVETLCDIRVLKNAEGKIVWPKEGVVCPEAD
ncbi:MAG: WG repeat-containing protein, partial [Zoogloeaceae bacterium]|nr:WG repeat-containing protein [Zoogloeaceae bacterium]